MRFLSMIRINEKSGQVPSEQLMHDMGKLIDEMTREGVLVRTAGLRPTAEGTRVRLRQGQLSTVDGPFIETKEVVGGFAILGNPVMIQAYQSGIPGNGKPLPDGARMAKIHWKPKPNQFFADATVPGDLVNVDFMVKDSKRFADGGGWGYAVFDYNAASDTFTPGTTAGTPPQGNDAKCGFACHTTAKARDYVFTEYGKR